MKKKIIFLSIIFITLMFMLFFLENTSYAGSQTMNNLEYEVNLNEDGSANITEIWNIRVYDTNTLFKTFELDSSKYGEIMDVNVSEILNDGQEKAFIRTNQYAYHVQKGYYYALNTKTTEFEIAWGVSINNSANKKYKITYTIKDAIKTYNDCSEFYWKFISTSNGIPCDNVDGTIKLPRAVSNKENIRVWAHGPLQGEIYATANDTVKFNVKYLNEGMMVEARVAVLEDIFSRNTNRVNQNKLEKIISEETNWANEANRQRDRLRQEAEREERIIKLIFTIAIIVGIGIFVVLIIKAIKYAKELSNVKKQEPETKVEYFRDFPDKDATAGEAAFLYYFDREGLFKKNVSKVVSGIIMNLSLKNVISFEQDQKNKMNIVLENGKDTSMLKVDEIEIYNLLNNVKSYKNKKNKNEENTNSISMKDIEKYAKNNDTSFLSKIENLETRERVLQETKRNFNNSKIQEAKKWKTKANGYFMAAFMCLCFAAFIVPIFAIIPCIICGILCSILAKKTRLLGLTQKGVNEQELWKGLKRYMENFSLLNEREVPELVLWEKYLVYATAFGIADKVLSQLKIKYPELNDENYMRNNGYMYMYMMNRYNFDRVLNSSMQKAYSAGLREKAARQAAASSSYSSGGGFGGGFSGGGGGRRRPVAGMGGR